MWWSWKCTAPTVGNTTDRQPQLRPPESRIALHPDQVSPGLLPTGDWAQWVCECSPIPARCGTPLPGEFSSGPPQQPDGDYPNVMLQSEMLPAWPSFLASPLHRVQTCIAVGGSPTLPSFLYPFPVLEFFPLNLWFILVSVRGGSGFSYNSCWKEQSTPLNTECMFSPSRMEWTLL